MLSAIPVFPIGSGHDDPLTVLLWMVVFGGGSLLVFFAVLVLMVRFNRRRG